MNTLYISIHHIRIEQLCKFAIFYVSLRKRYPKIRMSWFSHYSRIVIWAGIPPFSSIFTFSGPNSSGKLPLFGQAGSHRHKDPQLI